MHTFWRGFGYFLCLVAFALLVVDIWKSILSESLVITSLGQYWFDISAPSLNFVQAVIQRHIWPFLWDPLIVTFLMIPALLLFALPGGVLLYATHPFSPGTFRIGNLFD